MIPSPSGFRQLKRVLHFWLTNMSSGKIHIPKGPNALMSMVEQIVNQMVGDGSPDAADELAEYKELAERARDIFQDGSCGGKSDQEMARQLADDVKRMEHIWEFYLTDDEKEWLVKNDYWAAGDVDLALEIRDEVVQFAQLMEVKMRKHDPSTRWKKSKRTDLYLALKKELEKLEPLVKFPIEADKKTITPDDIASQAADVANFAMMIADVCGGLRWRTETTAGTERARKAGRKALAPVNDSRTTPAEQQS